MARPRLQFKGMATLTPITPPPAALTAAITTAWLGRPVYYFAQLGSTNTWLKEQAAAGAPAGALAVTEFQTAGKGRLGRRWEAPAGACLLFSVLLRPSWALERANWLTMLSGLAVTAALTEMAGPDVRAALKWPNDVMLHTPQQAWRKVGGILLEADLQEGGWQAAVIGMGINVNVAPAELPAAAASATSLLAVTGRRLDRWQLLGRICAHLEEGYAAAVAGRSPHAAWQAQLITLGQRVEVVHPPATAPTLVGVAETTDAWGRLVVRDDAGRRHTLAAGDVSLAGLP